MDSNFLQDRINERKRQLESYMMAGQDYLRTAPPGRLVIHRGENRLRYYVNDRNGRHYLKRTDEKTIRNLAQKSYWENVARVSKLEWAALNKLEESPALQAERPEELYYKLDSERKAMVTPIHWNDEDYVKRWCSKTFPENTGHEIPDSFISSNGVWTRSKSELIIANALEEAAVPYYYEPFLELGDRDFHPDFLALNIRTRREYYWEHFGRMDEENYANQTVWKLNWYEAHNIQPGQNLICTYETRRHPLNSAQVYRLIDEILK